MQHLVHVRVVLGAQHRSPSSPDAAEVWVVAVHHEVLDRFFREAGLVEEGCVDWRWWDWETTCFRWRRMELWERPVAWQRGQVRVEWKVHQCLAKLLYMNGALVWHATWGHWTRSQVAMDFR